MGIHVGRQMKEIIARKPIWYSLKVNSQNVWAGPGPRGHLLLAAITYNDSSVQSVTCQVSRSYNHKFGTWGMWRKKQSANKLCLDMWMRKKMAAMVAAMCCQCFLSFQPRQRTSQHIFFQPWRLVICLRFSKWTEIQILQSLQNFYRSH